MVKITNNEDRTNTTTITLENEKRGNEVERRGAENHCLIPFMKQTCIDFQFQYSHTSQHTETNREAERSEFPIKAVCLFHFVHVTVPQNVFFIKLVSEAAGQTSLEKAGQRVFRWTEVGGRGQEWP